MTFQELKLYIAIKKCNIGGADYNSEFERIEMAAAIMREYVHTFKDSVFPFSIDEICRHRMAFRKNKNTQTKVAVAIKHGSKCFWDGRGKGECSSEVDCGHIVADSRGGDMTIENCMIECSSHNRQRGVLTIEEYMLSAKSTQSIVRHDISASFDAACVAANAQG